MAEEGEMRLEGKAAVVTGAGAGIGRAVAELFAEEGASVLIAEIDERTGRETAERISMSGGRAEYQQTDTSNSGSVSAMAAAAKERFGGVDVLVNNAAAFVFGGVEEVTEADWERAFGVNVIGYANCVREVLPLMKEAGGGSIVNMSSISAFIGQPEFIPYNATKGAILNLTRCLAVDLAPDNIRVNAICPGAIRTGGTDRHIESLNLDREQTLRELGERALLKRMGTTREVAWGALFLASDEASFVTGGHLVMDGGFTVG